MVQCIFHGGEPWRLKRARVPFCIEELKEFSQQKSQASVSEIIQKKKCYRFPTLSNFWALSMESLCLIEWWSILWEKWGVGPRLSPLLISFFIIIALVVFIVCASKPPDRVPQISLAPCVGARLRYAALWMLPDHHSRPKLRYDLGGPYNQGSLA